MEVWIPRCADTVKLEKDINHWLKVTTEYPYVYKIQDRINSYFPTFGLSKHLYIITLKEGEIKIPHLNLPKKYCSICLQEDSEVFETLPVCNHSFHLKCINEWLRNKNTCPLCRLNIN